MRGRSGHSSVRDRIPRRSDDADLARLVHPQPPAEKARPWSAMRLAPSSRWFVYVWAHLDLLEPPALERILRGGPLHHRWVF